MKLIWKIGAFFADIIEVGVTALAIFVFLYLFVFQPHEVKGSSMYPNFENGQFLLTDKISYRTGKPQRGDVIVFQAPLDENYDYIKRIIALPGESVMVKDGSVFINNLKLNEGYILSEVTTRSGKFLNEGTNFVLPPDNYIVMGDNRDHSSDSRSWGLVPKGNIVGKVMLRYWPPDKAGKIPKTEY